MTKLEQRIEKLEQAQHRILMMLEQIARPNVGRLYNVDDAAELLSVKPATLREWLRDGKVEAVKLGGAWKISDSELRMLINKTN